MISLTIRIKTDKVVEPEKLKKLIREALGTILSREIISMIDKMALVDTGEYRKVQHKTFDDGVIVFTNVEYAKYLEYGTLEYFSRFGLDNFPAITDPKKKDLKKYSEYDNLRKSLPKGMQPFSPFRRVLFNTQKMEKIIAEAVEWALESL